MFVYFYYFVLSQLYYSNIWFVMYGMPICAPAQWQHMWNQQGNPHRMCSPILLLSLFQHQYWPTFRIVLNNSTRLSRLLCAEVWNVPLITWRKDLSHGVCLYINSRFALFGFTGMYGICHNRLNLQPETAELSPWCCYSDPRNSTALFF